MVTLDRMETTCPCGDGGVAFQEGNSMTDPLEGNGGRKAGEAGADDYKVD